MFQEVRPMRTLKWLHVAGVGAALLALVLAAAPAYAQRFRMAGRGFRVPGTGGTLNPRNYYDPYGNSRRAAFNIRLYGGAISRVPPYALGYGGYGGYGGYYGGYGGYYGGYDPYESDYAAGPIAPAKPILTAEEQVWPVALRVLPGQEAKALRAQIDGLLQSAASGRPRDTAVQELAQATDRLRKLLRQQREERGGLAEASYEDAEHFLDNLGGK
jgi:hypothetical protein